MSSITSPRTQAWRWWVCGLLLLATTINYMDRQTLSQLKVDIEGDLGLVKQKDYGVIEGAFGLAFATGCLVFGFGVDRWNVFWVYPLALIGWSAVGFLTGFAQGFWSLLLLRVLLGFFEAANWPCALRTTQRILTPNKRAMGNGILQSGAAIGAILIPLVVLVLFDKHRPETWRLPFFAVGAIGTLWVALWWLSVRRDDLALHTRASAEPGKSQEPELPPRVFRRRFLVLIALVTTINMTWHYLRAWHPSYLREGWGFEPEQVSYFSAGYYLFTDLGALSAGFVAMRLAGPRRSVHASRRLVFFSAALLTMLCLLVPFLSQAWLMVGLLLAIGFGALGVFPCYYSFSQDLTTRNQGKVTGTLGACCWVAMFLWQVAIGQIVAATSSYTIPFVISGLAPMFGFLMLLLFWGEGEELVKPDAATAPPVHARVEAMRPAAS
jgi:ACS family hexuronate transporter-like MFS transporter